MHLIHRNNLFLLESLRPKSGPWDGEIHGQQSAVKLSSGTGQATDSGH